MAYSFARRDEIARSQGWESYGHKRAAQVEAKTLAAYGPEMQAAALQAAQEFKTAGERRTQMKIWSEGARALAAGDKERARDLAAQLPLSSRLDPEVAESAFWYHK